MTYRYMTNNRMNLKKAAFPAVFLVASLCWSQQHAVPDASVPPPPMGWSSWNSFSNRIDSQIAVAQAKAMIDSGMARHGYQYINIDEGWWLGARDEAGNIVVDKKQWPALTPDEQPGDMSNIVKYIHSLGLKAGIYTDAGESGCSFYGPDLGPPMRHTGSEGHYEQDFLQFAKWGFDYVKVDWCGGNSENLDPALQYAEIARAIKKAEQITGHTLYFSICNWGKDSPWTWGPGIRGVTADIWRTSGDIVAPIVADSPNSGRRASYTGMLGNFDKGIHPEAQHTGFYNDPDMMVLGMPGLTDAQNRVHMMLWAISGAPLIVGADLTKLDPQTLAMLTNKEVLAVDQDPLGLQAIKIAGGDSSAEIWVKKLAGTTKDTGRRAVLLLNRSKNDLPATISWSEIGLKAGTADVHDAWTSKDLGQHINSYQTTVAGGDAVMLIIDGDETWEGPYRAVEISGKEFKDGTNKSAWRLSDVKSASNNTWLRIAYSNPGAEADLMELRINGERQSIISFPPTGTADKKAVTVEVRLKGGNAANEVVFSPAEPEQTTLDRAYIISIKQ